MIESDDSFLQALFSPITPDEFRKDFWPDEVFVIHGPLERLPPPFTNPELSSAKELFSRYRGRVLFSKKTRGPSSVLMQQANPMQLYEMGLSLYLPDIEPVVSGATQFLRRLEKALGIEEGDARITAWASPSADGISCHLDAEEVFSIQLQGVKRFYVAEKKAIVSPAVMQFAPGSPPYPDLYPQVSDGFPRPEDFEFTEVEMKPGSILYMPRGVWHRTEADRDSLSVSVILSPISTAERLLRELRSLLLQDPDWRRPFYGTSNPIYKNNGSPDLISSLLKKLPDVVKTIRAENLAPPTETERLENIQPDTRFQRIPGTHIATQQVADPEASPTYKPVLKYLEDRAAAFAVQELLDKFKDIPLKDHQRELRQLAKNKALQVLWFRKA